MDNNISQPYGDEDSMIWEIMKRQSTTYFELTELVQAIEALGRWRVEEDHYLNKYPKPASIPPSLREAKKNLTTAIEPLLAQTYLQSPADLTEEKDIEFIRTEYLPEILIAYNTVLHAAGNLVSREALLESMDLATVIAEKDNPLSDDFVKAGRMRELMTGFALTSEVMLVLKAEGKAWRPRKDRMGKDLGVWEMGVGVGEE